jgi:hypothetical protein
MAEAHPASGFADVNPSDMAAMIAGAALAPGNVYDVLDAAAHLPGIERGHLQIEHRLRHLAWRARDLERRRRRLEETLAEVHHSAAMAWADLVSSGAWSEHELRAALRPGLVAAGERS